MKYAPLSAEEVAAMMAGQEVEHTVGRWLGDQAVGPVLARYAYLGAGTVIQETFTEPQIRLNYDPTGDGSLTGLDRFARAVDHLLQQDDGQMWSPIDRFRYGYDAAGNRTWRENVLADAAVGKDLSEAYVYDELYRLIGADRGRFDQGGFVKQTDYQAWTLDGLGNFAQFKEHGDGQGGWTLEQERTVNAANEITGLAQGQGQAAWIAPLYDAAGNVASAPAPGNETTRLHFTYDAWNRMVQVHADDAQQPGQPGDLLARYFYDGVKRRIEKVLTAAAGQAGSVAYYHNAGWQVLEERAFDDQHEPTHSYQTVWSPRYIDAPILRDRYDNQGGLEAGARLYYLGDANYNVTALVGLVEVEPAVFVWQVAERYAYDPYGKAAYFDAEFEPLDPQQSAHDNASLFAGYRYDAETGLYHVRHRYYHSTLATWITRDPLGYAAGDASLYRYCSSNPSLYVDPHGLSPDLDAYIGQIKKHLACGPEREYEYMAAEYASRMYFEIANIGQYVRPLASAFLRNWLDGAPKNPYIVNDHVQAAINDRSGPYQGLQEYLIEWANDQTTMSGTFDTSMLKKQQGVSSNGIYVYATKGVYYHALGGFTVDFHGEWKRSGTKVKFTGVWRIIDTYCWKPGLTANVAGTIIPDDYALLVEKYFGAKPFVIIGAWHGTMTFDCANPVPMPYPGFDPKAPGPQP